MNFFEKTGKMALGSRLRLLTSNVTEDAARIYELYDIEFSPKWFPVFFILSKEGEKTITEIANEIGHSQPSVTKIVKEMTQAGLIHNNLKSSDKRKNRVGLTLIGEEIALKVGEQANDIEAAMDELIEESNHNLWEALAEWEFLLEQNSLFSRVNQIKKNRESKNVEIVSYEPKYHEAFRGLNEEWISAYFEMEEADFKALDNPKEHILDKGGEIFVALYGNEPVGVCALKKIEHEAYDFELAKMAVSPKAQGKNIGFLLGQKVVQKARELGGRKIYLESNTLLRPAIHLYQKLGFQKVVGLETPYKRSNIQMELDL